MGELLDKLLTINDSKNCEITNSDIEALSAEIASPEIYKTNSLLQNTSLLNKTSTTEMSILKSMRADCYSLYGEVYMQIKSGGTTVITKEQYDEIVRNLHQYGAMEKKTQDMKNSYRQYSLGTQIQNNELFRKIKVLSRIVKGKPGEVLKKVIWYEHLFEVIHEAHLHLAHAREPRSHKMHRFGGESQRTPLRFTEEYAQNVYERLSQ
jgi:hypothetical protein